MFGIGVPQWDEEQTSFVTQQRFQRVSFCYKKNAGAGQPGVALPLWAATSLRTLLSAVIWWGGSWPLSLPPGHSLRYVTGSTHAINRPYEISPQCLCLMWRWGECSHTLSLSAVLCLNVSETFCPGLVFHTQVWTFIGIFFSQWEQQ